MPEAKDLLLLILCLVATAFAGYWFLRLRQTSGVVPDPIRLGIGVVTDFFDTLGIGSFATTTALFRATKTTEDRLIPGTLNVGHTLPTVVQALWYTKAIQVDTKTLILMIASSVLGAWLGAGLVARWSRRMVQMVMGLALLGAATMFLLQALEWIPAGKAATGLDGTLLVVGVAGNFALGVLMTMGIGLYGPCLVLVSLLGMNPKAAFPIMMGSCAFLMPVASVRFMREQSVDHRAALGLTLGGIPAVLVAAKWFEEMPLTTVRWLVVVIVLFTATTLLLAARRR